MSSPNKNITKCIKCHTIIGMTKDHSFPCNGIFVGTCTNYLCSNANSNMNVYFCVACHNYCAKTPLNKGGRTPGLFSTKRATKQHFNYKIHQLATKDNNIDCHINLNIPVDETPFLDNVVDHHNDAINNNLPDLEQIKRCGFSKESNSPNYFIQEQEYPGKGAKYLTAKAYNLQVEDVTMEEIHFTFSMASLLCNLTLNEQKALADILKIVANTKDPEKPIFKKTRPPMSVEDFDDIYLKGKNAILPNLPHPIPQESSEGNHAFVGLIDLLANELAFGTQFENYNFNTNIQFSNVQDIETTKISNTNVAYNLYFELNNNNIDNNEFTLYLWLKEWRDDFDPNNTKSSRNQVWINTYTICPPKNKSSGNNTYFMAISGKGENHSEIERLFANELELLSKDGAMFYHGGLKEIIRVKVGKLMTCVDRPERTSMFHCGDHNGSYSSNWGYAGMVDGKCVINNLPSCKSCRRKNVLLLNNTDTIDQDRICENKLCSNWNVLDSNLSWPAPNN